VSIGSEILSGQAVIALPLILGGVALVAIARDRREAGQPVASAAPPES